MYKNILNLIFQKLGELAEYIISSTKRVVLVFAIIGFSISYVFGLTMSKDAWFWFFSSIAQTFAALVALVAVFLSSRLESYNAMKNKNMEIMRALIDVPDEKQDYLISDDLLLKKVEQLRRPINETKQFSKYS